MKDPLSGGRVHIIGIGGIGMSAIAEIMAARGLDVQGSDQKDGANLRRLSSKGIKVFVGQCAENLEGASDGGYFDRGQGHKSGAQGCARKRAARVQPG